MDHREAHAAGDNAGDDELIHVEDDLDTVTATIAVGDPAWTIVIVDDDDELHRSTDFALTSVEILGRPLIKLHAWSAVEGEALLTKHPDVAVVLLDVVMETEDAGLRLVRRIRDHLGMHNVRIILRTGQPGYAPELSVIRDYDINDYRTKSELTRVRLLTSLHSALRSFAQVQALDASRQGLKKIIHSTNNLFAGRKLSEFCEGVLIQLGSLLETPITGFVLARSGHMEPGTIPEDRTFTPQVVAASGTYRALTGCHLEELSDEPIRSMLTEVLARRRTVHRANATVLHVVAPSGEDIAIYMDTGRSLGDLDRSLLEVFATNIALGFDNAALMEQIQAIAFVDPLTGLGTRSRFSLDLSLWLARNDTIAEPQRVAVILTDLDHFGVVNDGLGHEVGDGVLRAVANTLSSLFEHPASLARLSSDCFAAMAPIGSETEVAAILDAITVVFSTPFTIMGNSISVSATLGYTVFAPERPRRAEDMLREASMALKRAKKTLRGTAVRFDPGLADDVQNRVTLVSRLAEARREHQFSVVYQPQVRLNGGSLTGMEALLRWRTPDGGMVPPSDFIPAAEESGHIVPMGEWVLREALTMHARWQGQGIAPPRTAINVSLRQLRERGFVATMERMARACCVEPAQVELEVTESTAMEGAGVLDALEELHKLGFRIAIDDFGTGYSSLSRLRTFPVSVLKIDRSFINGLPDDGQSRAVVATIVRLAHEFGLTALAEGIETDAQRRILAELGCHEGQGYLISNPLADYAAEAFLRRRAPDAPIPSSRPLQRTASP